MRQTSNSFPVLSVCALALGTTMIALPKSALAQISVSITLAPPALPVYEQPVLVEEGGIWAPGYWAYDQEDGYFWVPGTWVQPPEVGLLWTPGYWGWGNGGYAWNEGYWSPTVGFYGGIAYGFGYFGQGYTGGRWQGQQFYYNTSVSHVNVTNIHNTYTQTVVNNTTVNRVSFNGGTGGVTARPTAAEQAAARGPHQSATTIQMQHRQAAMANHALSASVNHGKPPIAATSKPAELNGPGVVKASAAGSPEKASRTVVAGKAPQTVAAAPAAKRAPVHAADLPPVVHQAGTKHGQCRTRQGESAAAGRRCVIARKNNGKNCSSNKQPITNGPRSSRLRAPMGRRLSSSTRRRRRHWRSATLRSRKLCKRPSRRSRRQKARRHHTPSQEQPSWSAGRAMSALIQWEARATQAYVRLAHRVQGLECLSLALPHKSSKFCSQGF